VGRICTVLKLNNVNNWSDKTDRQIYSQLLGFSCWVQLGDANLILAGEGIDPVISHSFFIC
jgi:hypothetical protein